MQAAATTTDSQQLNSFMEFDSVVRVFEGVAYQVSDVFAPSLYWIGDTHEIDGQGWQLMSGYSGQHGYSGPIMHESEFIGGRMADDILASDGLYVALVCSDIDDEDGGVAGWAVAFIAD